MRSVIAVHAPSAERSRAVGFGPVSVPPREAGSSLVHTCWPEWMLCAYPVLPSMVTVTALAPWALATGIGNSPPARKLAFSPLFAISVG